MIACLPVAPSIDLSESHLMNVHTPATQVPPSPATSLWERLKAETRSTHGSLDERIMSARPFADRERYVRFLRVQHDFHQLVSPLYQNLGLGALLPDLASRDRLAAVRQDLRDLGHEVAPVEVDVIGDLPTSLGWLYVAEGSNLGAAFLLKAARAIGLSEEFGARHLAPAQEGRGLHWKSFTAALDAIDLSPEDVARVTAGANAAFSRVLAAVEARFFNTAG